MTWVHYKMLMAVLPGWEPGYNRSYFPKTNARISPILLAVLQCDLASPPSRDGVYFPSPLNLGRLFNCLTTEYSTSDTVPVLGGDLDWRFLLRLFWKPASFRSVTSLRLECCEQLKPHGGWDAADRERERAREWESTNAQPGSTEMSVTLVISP